MNSYFGYIRVSTDEQVSGASLKEQRSAIEAFAQRQNLTITGWFEEVETAAKLGRGKFTAMLAALERGEAQGVIIHKIDRSARHLTDWARIGELLDLGVAIHFAHENLDLTTRGGRLAADIQAVVATDYIRNLRQEIRKGIDGRLKEGLYPLPAPLGYTNCGKGKRKEIDPVRGPLVRTAFQLYATGQYSVDELRAEMARRGLRGRRGSQLSRTGMWHLLRNPFYIGLIHIKRTGRTYDGVHEPLVRKNLFDRCQAILSGRKYVATSRHDFAFSRLVRCAGCGRSLIGERQKGHVYYRCHSVPCRGTSLAEHHVQTELRILLSFLTLDDGEVRDLRDLYEHSRKGDRAERAAAVAQAKRALGRCDDLLLRLTDAFLDGTVEPELFERRKAKLLAERRDQIDLIESPSAEGETLTVLKKVELGRMALHKAEMGNGEKTREAVSMVMSNLVAQRKQLGFTLLFPFDRLLKERICSHGAPYRAEPRTPGTYFRASHPVQALSPNTVRTFKEFLLQVAKPQSSS